MLEKGHAWLFSINAEILPDNRMMNIYVSLLCPASYICPVKLSIASDGSLGVISVSSNTSIYTYPVSDFFGQELVQRYNPTEVLSEAMLISMQSAWSPDSYARGPERMWVNILLGEGDYCPRARRVIT